MKEQLTGWNQPEKEPKEKSPRESGLLKVVSGSEEEQERAMSIYRDLFQRPYEGTNFNQLGTEIRAIERDKTAEEKEILEQVIDKLGDFVKYYGGRAPDFGPDHIALIDKKKVPKSEKRSSSYFVPELQMVVIYPEYTSRSKLLMAQTAAHELLHFCSFQSVNVKKGSAAISDRISARRCGLAAFDNDDENVHLNDINEAITEELVRRFDRQYFGEIPELGDELDKRERYKKQEGKSSDVSCLVKIGGILTAEVPFRYRKERIHLQEIIRTIYENNADKYNSPEEVFDQFARSYFDGNLLAVARLIENTFGQGSFRKLADETKIKVE